jgi:phage-related minor tail protein
MTDPTSLAAPLALETQRLQAEMASLTRLGENFGATITRAFASAIVDGRKLSDVLKGLALSLSRQALSAAIKPLGDLLGGLFANANGNVISGGRVQPFAGGGIVNSPVLFPLRGGTGLMGEAGPEAIMPLARGSDGKLGVRGGGSGARITVNIATPDAASFAASQGQVAALIARAAARGQRNL